jgi:hypothetical protein
MIQSIDRWITVEDLGLVEKTGGSHGLLAGPEAER